LHAYDITHAQYHDIMEHEHGSTGEDMWYGSDSQLVSFEGHEDIEGKVFHSFIHAILRLQKM